MGKNLTASQIADRWSAGMQRAGDNYVAGINAVTENPGQKAANQADKWATNTANAKPLWQQQMAGMDMGFWKSQATNKGKDNLTRAGTTAKPRVARFMEQWLPFVRNGAANLRPRGSFEDNMSRASDMARMEHEARGRFRTRGKNA